MLRSEIKLNSVDSILIFPVKIKISQFRNILTIEKKNISDVYLNNELISLCTIFVALLTLGLFMNE